MPHSDCATHNAAGMLFCVRCSMRSSELRFERKDPWTVLFACKTGATLPLCRVQRAETRVHRDFEKILPAPPQRLADDIVDLCGWPRIDSRRICHAERIVSTKTTVFEPIVCCTTLKSDSLTYSRPTKADDGERIPRRARAVDSREAHQQPARALARRQRQRRPA